MTKNQPYMPFKEDYEIFLHSQGTFLISRIGTGGSQKFASFTTKEKAQEFLNSCPSKKELELKKLISF